MSDVLPPAAQMTNAMNAACAVMWFYVKEGQ